MISLADRKRAALAADADACTFCSERGHQALECPALHDAQLEEAIARRIGEEIGHGGAADRVAGRVMEILRRDGWRRDTAELHPGTRVPVAKGGKR